MEKSRLSTHFPFFPVQSASINVLRSELQTALTEQDVGLWTSDFGSRTSRPAPRSHGPRDVGCVLLGLHAQHGDAGRASLELRLALEGVVAVGGRREEGVGAEEVVQGDVAELVLLVGEAHVAVVGGAGSRTGRVGVGGDAGRGAPGQHAGGDHGAAGSRARPQVVGELMGRRKKKD